MSMGIVSGTSGAGYVAPTASTSVSGAQCEARRDGGAGSARWSRRAQFTTQVLSLASSDPAKAKQMVLDLEKTMRSRADQGGKDAARAGKIADMLQKVADTGDYSALGSWQDGPQGAGAAAQAYAVTRTSR